MKSVLALLLISSLTGCGTAYRASSDGKAPGYRELRIGEGLYEVEYAGDPSMTGEHVASALLYRCAEIARAEGADRFAVLDSKFGASLTGYHMFSGGAPLVVTASTNQVASPAEMSNEKTGTVRTSVPDAGSTSGLRTPRASAWRDFSASAVIQLKPTPAQSLKSYETSAVLSKLERVAKKKVLL